MPLKPEYREETYEKKPNKVAEIVFVVIAIILFLTFSFYRYDNNVYRLKIYDIESTTNIFGDEKVTFMLNAKDLFNIDATVHHFQTLRETLPNEIKVELTRDKHDTEDTKITVSVNQNQDTIVFCTEQFDFKTKLVKDTKTGTWSVEK